MEISLGVLVGFAALWVWLLIRAVKSCYSGSLPASRDLLKLPRSEEDSLKDRERELRVWNSPSSLEGKTFRRHVQIRKAAEKISLSVEVTQRFWKD